MCLRRYWRRRSSRDDESLIDLLVSPSIRSTCHLYCWCYVVMTLWCCSGGLWCDFRPRFERPDGARGSFKYMSHFCICRTAQFGHRFKRWKRSSKRWMSCWDADGGDATTTTLTVFYNNCDAIIMQKISERIDGWIRSGIAAIEWKSARRCALVCICKTKELCMRLGWSESLSLDQRVDWSSQHQGVDREAIRSKRDIHIEIEERTLGYWLNYLMSAPCAMYTLFDAEMEVHRLCLFVCYQVCENIIFQTNSAR